MNGSRAAALGLLNGADSRWQSAPKGDAHAAVAKVIDRLEDRQGYRREKDMRHMRLYGDVAVLGAGPWSYSRASSTALGQLSLNIVKNCANSVTARITKSRVRPMFLTSEGDWTQQQRAKGLQRFTEGQFYESAVYSRTPACCLDSTVYGTGIAQIYREGNEIRVERVFPPELLVDDAEGMYGTPRSLYRKKTYDRLVVAAMFPDNIEEIEKARRSTDRDYAASDATADLITVIEAWHLPSGPKAKDGRHVIVLENATLLDEPWERDHFPFAFLRWDDPLLGFWGTGLAEQLTGIQLEINRLLRHIQQSFYLAGNLKVFVPRGSKVLKGNLNNEIGTMVEFDGAPPSFAPNMTVHPEIFQHLWALRDNAYQITGVSQLSAQSQKPAGLNSGKALQVYSDVESERFVRFGRAWEEFHLEIARQMVELAREIAKEDPGYSVRFVGKGMMDVVRLSEVDLDEEAYVMQCFPTSALAQTPAARLSQVQDMFNTQLITKDQANQLLDFPDLQEFEDDQNAPHDLVMKCIELMRDKGKYMSPEPEWDLDDCLRSAQLAYNRGVIQGVPDDRLELIRNFMEDAKALQDQAAPPPAPQGPPGMPPMPPGGPMPPGAGMPPMPPAMGAMN